MKPPLEVVPFHKPYYGRSAQARLANALARGELYGDGDTVREVEQRIASLLGAKHLVLTPSCTAALEIAAEALGLGPGDEVIVPGYTFVSSAAAISRTGAHPIFVDVDPRNLCLDLDRIELALTPRTRAIVAVHYAGQACDMARLMAFASERGLFVIEDAAQAFMCEQAGRKLGTIGHFGAYSFHDTKVFSAGEGGALVINDATFLDRAIKWREKGTNRRAFLAGEVDRYGWVAQGTSAYLSGIAAALLDAQLDEIDDIIARRRSIYARYAAALNATARRRGWSMIVERQSERLTHHIFWLMAPNTEEHRRFAAQIAKEGISSAAHYPSLQSSPYALDRDWSPAVTLSVTDMAAECLLRLPIFTEMTSEQVERVIVAATNALAD